MKLTRTVRWVIVTVLLLVFLGIAFYARRGNHSKVDQLFDPWTRKDSPGAAVVVVKDGVVVYERGYGYANLEHRVAITPQTRFDVASVAKQFTGLAVAMLVQRGKLSLDDDIRSHLPDVPDFGRPITIGHLVHHTSGLRDWPETLGLAQVNMEEPIRLEMILEMVRRQRELDFLPGEEHFYSNTGYNLLAAVVAKVIGQSFRAWSDANLFQPLHMEQTLVCSDPAEVVPLRADSYAPGHGGKFQRVVSQLAAQGSSSLFISARDMGNWLRNFENTRVGGNAIAMMQQPGRLNNGDKVTYGFGVGLGSYRGIPAFMHAGGWAGYRSFTIFVPEKRFAVAVLANTSNMNTHEQALKIADIYLGMSETEKEGKPASKPDSAVNKDPALWTNFPGTYRLGPGWLLTITREGDQFMAQATRENKFKMTPTSGRTFFVEAYNQAVEFVRQDSGAVTNLLYRGISAPKLDVPKMTPRQLAAYVGDYWSEELRVTMRIEIHEGKLANRMPTGSWLRFTPTGVDRFDAEAGNWTVDFVRDASSQVTDFRVSGGRVRKIRYTRGSLPNLQQPERGSGN